MAVSLPTCSWCAMPCDPTPISAGPAAGMKFCAQHLEAYGLALQGDPNWSFMLAAIERRQRKRLSDATPRP